MAKGVFEMATIPTRIWIEKTVNEQADTLLAVLGMEMSSTVNIFLHQCVLRGGPFLIRTSKIQSDRGIQGNKHVGKLLPQQIVA